MRKFRLTTFLLVFFVAFACEKAQNKASEEIEFKVELDKQETGIQVLSRGNVNLLVVDTLLIVQKSTEPFLEIYDTNTHKLMTTFGKHGEGPGEMLVPELINQREFENGSPIITVFDYERRIVNKINLKNLIQENEPVLKQNPLPFKGNYVVYFFHADQDFILGTTEANGRFTHYSYEHDSVHFIPFVPTLEIDVDERNKSHIFRSSVTVNKNKGLIAAFPILLGSVNFFDLDGELLRNTNFDDPEKFLQGFEEKDEDERSLVNVFVRDSDSDDAYIYGLNLNNRSSDLTGSILPKKMQIEVFDWEGSHIKQYVLNDDLPSESFAFDEKHNRFYTYCRECEDSNLSYFNVE
ncbi:TolB-like 6-blade propeller-like [Algoriphagus locisalis]|uniref:TolB-like 6-blade propeller-like n=1 Tax=Algoriphagus locisalis TaxID=305507 RepID=A0A1I7BGT0_9BACT|nr:BF3164 family lipoprotein [Algoriphagus locisalis]SFT86378.1 TolB-like 6-blade propeller-like [Algoriphagus locisalis]